MWSRVWPNICRLCLKPCFLNFSITIIISTTWQLFHLWQTSNIFVITVIIIIMILNIMINTSPSSEIFAKTQSGVLWLDTRAICIFWIFQNPPDQPEPAHSVNQQSPSSSSTKPRLNLSIETQLEPNYFCFKFRLHLKVQSHLPDFFIYESEYLYICIFIFILCVSVFWIWLLHL